MKVLSGILITRSLTSGTVNIDLARNEIRHGDLGGDALKRRRIVAPEGQERWYFADKPCNIVAMREFSVQFIDYDDPGSRPSRSQTDKLEINSYADEVTLTISWKAPSGSLVEEISYMVTGMPVEPEMP
jgi:hypothetical protein